MALIEIGRVCIKKLGRDAGAKAAITGIVDANFVNIITAERSKERRCNVKHLEFLNEKIDPKDREQLVKVLEISPEKLLGKQAKQKDAKAKK